MKRVFDILLALFGVVALSPLLLLCAVLVKATSTGPILYRQQRIGRHFRSFHILKFRSMSVDADQKGPKITAAGDPRITGVGRILRKTKLDELPQLFNVLVGDMSFVGPRPEVAEFVELFRQDYETLLRLRPGITGISSIVFRREESILANAEDARNAYITEVLPIKLALGKQYVEQSSIGLDIQLITLTVLRVAGIGDSNAITRVTTPQRDQAA